MGPWCCLCVCVSVFVCVTLSVAAGAHRTACESPHCDVIRCVPVCGPFVCLRVPVCEPVCVCVRARARVCMRGGGGGVRGCVWGGGIGGARGSPERAPARAVGVTSAPVA